MTAGSVPCGLSAKPCEAIEHEFSCLPVAVCTQMQSRRSGQLTRLDLQGFVREASRTIVIEGKTPAELLDKLAAYKGKWHMFVTMLVRYV